MKKVLRLRNFNGNVVKSIEDFEEVHGGYGNGKRNVEEKCYLNSVIKKNYVLETHGSTNIKKKKFLTNLEVTKPN